MQIPTSEFEITTSRSGGAGGQHVNKTSSRVTIRWNIPSSAILTESQRDRLLVKLASRLTTEGDLILHVDTSRSQIQNREIAYERLHELVDRALFKVKHRVPTKPTKGSQTRRIQNKKRIGDTKKQRGASHHTGD